LADDSEKTESPTPKRRREAREKGQVLKSKEVNTAALVLISAYSLSWFGPKIYENIFKYFTAIIEELPYNHLSFALAIKFCFNALMIMILTVLPVLFAVFLTAATVELLQVGILFTTKTLSPDLNKINPVKGFKRVFSLKSLVELVKGFVKTLIIGYIVYTVLRDNMLEIIATIREPPAGAFLLVGQLVLTISKKVAAAMIIIAGIDYFYQRWEFEKSLRMSKQEVKDEYKQTEGDPLIKSKQRQKQRQISRGQVRQAVPNSSAVVSNPTHYAIGILYKPDEMEAPVVTVKGEDSMAIYIKELAEKFGVPIFEDKELVRAMYPVCIVDKPIPPEFYMAVAQIVAQLMRKKSENAMLQAFNEQLKKQRRSSGTQGNRTWNAPGGLAGNQPPNTSAKPPDQGQEKSGPSSIFD